MNFDVGVLGVGSMGSMALWRLARRGAKVIGFEQFGVPHEHGAAGGETRIFRTAYREGREYVDLLRRARDLWRELEAESGLSLLNLNGFVTIGPETEEIMRGLKACMVDLELDGEFLSGAEVNRRYPALNAREDEVAIIDKAGGLLKPELSVVAAASVAERLGASLLRCCEVTSVESSRDGVWVRTSLGDYLVGKLIVAAGGWVSKFLPAGLIEPHRCGLSWFLAKEPGLFGPDLFPSSNRRVDGVDITMFSSQDGTTVKSSINGSIEKLGHPSENRFVEKREERRLSAIVGSTYPKLWPDPIRSGSYLEGFTPDNHAIVGELDMMPNVVVACGFSSHGFKMASAVGSALADLALDGKTDMPVTHLSTRRPMVTEFLSRSQGSPRAA